MILSIKKRVLALPTLIFLACLPHLAFGACENEHKMHDTMAAWCDSMTTASGIAGIAGAAIFPPLGGLVGALPGYDAYMACKKKGEWQNAVDACEQFRTEIANLEARERAQAQKVAADFSAYLEVYQAWDQVRMELSTHYSQLIREKINSTAQQLQQEGVDLALPEVQAQVKAAITPINAELESKLKEADERASADVKARNLTYIANFLSYGG